MVKRVPKSEVPVLGDLIDQLYAKRAERLLLAKQVNALEDEEREIRKLISDTLKAQGLKGGRGAIASYSIGDEQIPIVKDWAAFWKYLVRTKSYDLMQQRPAVRALLARKADKKVVPGVEWIPMETYSLTKNSTSVSKK